jgi:hypothetical protein
MDWIRLTQDVAKDDSTKARGFLDQLNDYQRLKKKTVS